MIAQTSSPSRPATILSVAIVAVYLALALVQVRESFVIDEMEFPRVAEAVAETGRPVYYRGEESPTHLGIFHPPLYGYTLGAWIALFGFSEAAVRLFGVLLMVGTAWTGVRIVKLLGLARQWGPPAFLALFLLHPYVIQSALLPDIDGTVLLFATVLLFYEITRVARKEDSVRNSAMRLGLALALAMAAKLTSVIVIPALFVGILFGRGLKRAVVLTGLSTVVGGSVFLIAWWTLASIADLPFAFPFEFTIQSGLKGGVSEAGVGELLRRLIPAQSTIYWLGVLLPAMAIVGTGILLAQWKSHAHRRVTLVFSLWSFGAIAFFSLISGAPFGFPKYYIAAIPTMAIVGIVPVDAVLEQAAPRSSSRWLGLALVLVLAGVSGWQFAQVSDQARYAWPGYLWTVALVVLSALVMASVIRQRGMWLLTLPVTALLIATLSYNLGMAAVQAADERSVRYFPGEVGFDETVDRLKELVGPDDLILVPKDIGSATYNRYHEEEQLFLDLDLLAEVLADEDVEYAVVRKDRDYSYLVFPEAQPIIEMEMDLMEEIGDFLIYERAPET